MKKIKIEDEEFLKMVEEFRKTKDYARAAYHMAGEQAVKAERAFWKYIQSKYPEIKNANGRFNHETNELIILGNDTKE